MKCFVLSIAAAVVFGPPVRKIQPESPSRAAAPGAGETAITATDSAAVVRKDGFYHVKCMHDGTQIFADNQSAQGQKRYAAQNANISVVWYKETVPSEDQQEMTPRVCFDFCRIQDRMGFFGLLHGRDCYCTPYYRSEAGGENEDCDLPCPGDQSQMCGGKHKSDIYSMHFCNNIDADLTKAKDRAQEVVDDIKQAIESGGNYERCKGFLQDYGHWVQQFAGVIGASAQSDHMQSAKVRSGQLERLFEQSEKLVEEHDVIVNSASQGSAIEKQQAQELQVIDLQKFQNKASEFYDSSSQVFAEVCDSAEKEGYEIKNEYRDVSYFGAKKQNIEYPDTATTCEGETIGNPRYQTAEGCALACQSTMFPTKCEGFGIYAATETSESGMCILFSKVTGGDIWDCEGGAFLQKKKEESMVRCFYRLSDATGFRPKVGRKDMCS